MSVAKTYLARRMQDRPVRTARGNEIIRRDPREVPRRLRGLLLAVDGRQSVQTYIQRLEGFGDIQELLWELGTLGLVELHSRRRSSADDTTAGGVDSTPASTFPPSDSPLIEEAALFETIADKTLPGGFEDLVRVARLDAAKAGRPMPPAPPATAPAPAPADMQKQVESLFALLESVRGERTHLKEQLAAARKYRDRAQRFALANERLTRTAYLLSFACAALVVAVGYLLTRR